MGYNRTRSVRRNLGIKPLQGHHIRVPYFVDHNPLKYLTEGAPKSAKLTRWALALQEYDVTFEYTKGTTNVVADCLSRLEPE